MKKNTATRYSEAFKRQVVGEIARGKFSSPYKAREAYGIRGNGTVERWIRKHGREDLLPKRIRIETMEEVDRLKKARKRIKELEAALADAHIDNCLEHAFLEIACERMEVGMADFKKKNALTLSGVRRKRGLK
ncbi:MAG: transposase [Candidatus Sabulitectum sp.]|nr:transposase [Candidatus Sabulitectum sp.]